jgi:hypothetical protein
MTSTERLKEIACELRQIVDHCNLQPQNFRDEPEPRAAGAQLLRLADELETEVIIAELGAQP